MPRPSLWYASTSPFLIILARLYGSLKFYFMPLLNPRSWCQTQALLTMGVLPPGHTGRIRGESVTQGRQPWSTVKTVFLSSWAVKSMWASFLVARGSWPIFVVVQWLSCVRLFATPWTAVCQASLPFTISQSSLRFMPIRPVMLSTHLIFCHPFLLLPSVFPTIRVFSNELAFQNMWPKYWNFSFSISPSNEYSGLISFRIDWFDFLAIQGTLKSLLQHHSSKASVLQPSDFFVVKSHIHTRLLEKP